MAKQRTANENNRKEQTIINYVPVILEELNYNEGN